MPAWARRVRRGVHGVRDMTDLPALDCLSHVVVDRDGVLNDEAVGLVDDSAMWRWLPGARQALVALLGHGLAVSVVTNQACIGRGDADGERIAAVHRALVADVAAVGAEGLDVFVCPHVDADACICRKPSPGLVLDALARHGSPPERALVIGDDLRDLAAGTRAGASVALVRTGKGASVADGVGADVPVFDNLAAVVKALGLDVPVPADPAGSSEGRGFDAFVTAFGEHQEVIRRSVPSTIPALRAAGELLVTTVRSGSMVLAVGNGGSASDAAHFVAELVGRFRLERRPVAAVVVGANTPTLTALSNDFGYEAAFAREIEALARPGDACVAISTSGRSPNVVAAARAARTAGCCVIALTGSDGADLSPFADVHVAVPSSVVAHVQEVHGLALHALAEMVEREVAEARQ